MTARPLSAWVSTTPDEPARTATGCSAIMLTVAVSAARDFLIFIISLYFLASSKVNTVQYTGVELVRQPGFLNHTNRYICNLYIPKLLRPYWSIFSACRNIATHCTMTVVKAVLQ